MFWTYLLMSLIFLFVYVWYRDEGRFERFVFLGWFILNGVGMLFYDIESGVINLSFILLVMLSVWYTGFKLGWGNSRGPHRG